MRKLLLTLPLIALTGCAAFSDDTPHKRFMFWANAVKGAAEYVKLERSECVKLLAVNPDNDCRESVAQMQAKLQVAKDIFTKASDNYFDDDMPEYNAYVANLSTALTAINGYTLENK